MISAPEYVNFDEYERVCRTCGEYGELLSLYERNDDNLTFADMIMECASIQANHNDGFPEKICIICVALVKQSYAFKQRCKQLDNFFHFNGEKPMVINPSEVLESTVQNELQNNAESDTPKDIDSDDSIIEIPSQIDIVKEELQYPDAIRAFVNPKENPVPSTRVNCPICSKSIKNYKQHMLTHSVEKRYICDVCGKRFTFAQYLKNHMVSHSDVTPHKCSTCGKAFKRPDTLKEHLMIHTGERPHICKNCGKAFRTLRHMKNHRIIHTKAVKIPSPRQRREPSEFSGARVKRKFENVSYTCDICDKQYRSSSALNQHVRVHREAFRFLCSDCGKTFNSKCSLDVHILTHTGVKEYECKICDKKFALKPYLTEHMRIHTGEKPYKCNICERAFVQSSHLKRHLSLMHGTGIKKYQCDICKKYFTQSTNLRIHRRIHTGETPYICPVCNKGFYDSGGLKKHRRTHITYAEKPTPKESL